MSTPAPTSACATYETAGTEAFGLANGIIAMSSVSIILQWMWVAAVVLGLAKETALKGRLFLIYILCLVSANGMFWAYLAKFDIRGHWECDHTNKAVWVYIGTWISFFAAMLGLGCTWRWWALDEADFWDNFRCRRANEAGGEDEESGGRRGRTYFSDAARVYAEELEDQQASLNRRYASSSSRRSYKRLRVRA